MYLHEEYIRRNGLNIPVVLYNHRSRAFLRSKDTPSKWRILAFYWHEPDRHPGYFEISFVEPVHNGHAGGKLIKDYMKPTMCYWDEYEYNVLKFVKYIQENGFEAIKPSEQILAAWQIFLIMYDSWLARHMDAGFFKLAGTSLDANLSLSRRMEAFEAAQSQLCIDKRTNDVWAFQLLPLAKSGSEWLVRLINEN